MLTLEDAGDADFHGNDMAIGRTRRAGSDAEGESTACAKMGKKDGRSGVDDVMEEAVGRGAATAVMTSVEEASMRS
jgi:hypothetical protein